jgi:hypothetical protein
MPYWMKLTLMYTGAKWRAAAQRRRTPNRRLLSVKRFLRVVSQHAYLTPYRYVRVVEGPKHYVCYPRVNSAYVNAYGRNRAPGGVRARRHGATAVAVPARRLSHYPTTEHGELCLAPLRLTRSTCP